MVEKNPHSSHQFQSSSIHPVLSSHYFVVDTIERYISVYKQTRRSFTMGKQQPTITMRLIEQHFPSSHHHHHHLSAAAMITLPRPQHHHHHPVHEEDSSVSSTIAVVRFDQTKKDKLSSPAPVDSKPLKKTVHFNEDDNQSYNNTQIYREDCQELWYNADDFAKFKASTKYLAREIGRCEKLYKSSPLSYQRVLKRTYAACCKSPCYNDDENSCVLTLEQEKHLQQWLQVSTSRLGLERVAIRAIAVDKSQRKRDLVVIILELQQQLMSSMTNSHK